jgi:hypothetical protein
MKQQNNISDKSTTILNNYTNSVKIAYKTNDNFYQTNNRTINVTNNCPSFANADIYIYINVYKLKRNKFDVIKTNKEILYKI